MREEPYDPPVLWYISALVKHIQLLNARQARILQIHVVLDYQKWFEAMIANQEMACR